MNRAMGVLLCGLLGAIGPAQAQILDLVADINTGANRRGDSYPSDFLTVNATTTYFFAQDAEHGRELWKTDGSTAGTVRITDICPGACDSEVGNMLRVGSRVFFSADDGYRGREPWSIDINTEVSAILADLEPGAGDSNPSPFTSAFGGIYFTVESGGRRTRLVRSDGTAAGTTTVNETRLWNSSVTLVPLGDSLYGDSAPLASTGGRELTRYSLVTGSATTVRDINPGSGAGEISSLLIALNPPRLVFIANDPATTGREVWMSDGTSAGTTVLTEPIPGPEGSSPSQLTVAGNRLFFTADNRPGSGSANTNVELYAISGSATSASPVREINPAADVGSAPNAIQAFGNEVMFLANDGITGSEIWRSDGTFAGTTRIRDFISSGPGNSSGSSIVANGFYYVAVGERLFRTDGTTANTRQVGGTPFPGATLSEFGAGNGFVYAQVLDFQSFGVEPMRTPIANPNVVDLLRNIASEVGDADPSDFTQVNGRPIFFAYDSVDGIEPRVIATSGATPTVLAQTIGGANAFGMGSFRSFDEIVVSGGRAFFVVDNDELWVTDGSSAGTSRLVDFTTLMGSFARAACLTPTAAGVLLVAETLDIQNDGDPDAYELWVSDGTTAGTARLAPTPSAVLLYNACRNFAVVGNFVLIAGAGDAALGGTQRGEELYRFDLTTGANELVRDIRPGADGSSPVGFRAVGDTVYFMAAQAQGDFELWRSDGTAQGTRLVAEINAGGASYPGGLTNIGPTLYFHAKGPAGREVYRSDGTPAGTTVLRDIQAGTGSGLDSNAALVASGGRIFFAATNSPARLGARLYVSDGTTAGTVELGDVAANQPGNAPQEIIAAPDGAVLFSGWSPDAGRELWYSDGTDAGTLRVDDLAPGSRSANPIELTIVGEQLYLSADDSVRGREAYRLDLAALEFSQIFRDGFE